MEDLPFVDEHAAPVRASRERTWDALVRVVRSDLSGGGLLARALGASPSARAGDWAGDLSGATLPGFAVAEARRPARLVLRGRHRFARYALVFAVEERAVRAQTWAAFPGLRGRLYRAVVIGSGAHRLLVRRLLRRVAAGAGG